MPNTTIKEVAKAANVSIATVSRVINDNTCVKPHLKARVLEAIESLNYYPNSVARSLKTSSTSTIAYLVSNISDAFFTTLAKGIEDSIKDHNYNLIVCSTDNSGDMELNYLKVLSEKKVDGIILNTTGKNDDFVATLSQQMPFVLSNRKVDHKDFRGDLVDYENIGGIYDLTLDLIRLGHKKIGLFNGPTYLSTGYERFKGFSEAMATIGITINAEYPFVFSVPFTSAGGYEAAQKCFETADHPTAIVLANGEIALGALDYFFKHDIQIPRDLSIVSFGNIVNRDLLYVRPTISEANVHALGGKMGDLMMERIEQKNLLVNREVRFTMQIKQGNSTRQCPG